MGLAAYGQTGSGKTHTLIGQIDSAELEGVVPRALKHLSRGLAARSQAAGIEFNVSVHGGFRGLSPP